MIEIVKDALALARRRVRELGSEARRKIEDGRVTDISTVGDRAISDALISFFKDSRIPAIVLSEETGRVEISTNLRYTIVIDDIDGTDNYFRGDGMLPYCTAISVLEGLAPRFSDTIAAGILEHPTGTTWTAEQGSGTSVNGNRVESGGNVVLDRHAVVVVDHYASSAEIERLSNLYPVAWVKDFGSAALHLAGTASGMFDAYLSLRQKSHEIAAGYLLVNEAGGVFNDLSGIPFHDRPYDFEATYEVLAARMGSISASILEMMQR
jgi:myo-inositol-1(or 4)-monophosphatase